jgi:hypothetical protein
LVRCDDRRRNGLNVPEVPSITHTLPAWASYACELLTGFQRLMGALQMLVLSLKFLVRCDEVMVAVA